MKRLAVTVIVFTLWMLSVLWLPEAHPFHRVFYGVCAGWFLGDISKAICKLPGEIKSLWNPEKKTLGE